MNNKIKQKTTSITTVTTIMTIFALLFIPTGIDIAKADTLVPNITYNLEFSSDNHGSALYMTVDEQRNTYFVYGSLNTIEKWNSNGDYITSWSTPDEQQDITSDSLGNIYSINRVYLGNNNYELTVNAYDSNGNFTYNFTVPYDEVDYAWDIAIDKTTDIIYHPVRDFVYMYDIEGNPLGVFSSASEIVEDITVDKNSNVYTVDYSHVVTKYNSTGSIQEQWDLEEITDISEGDSNYMSFYVDQDLIYIVIEEYDLLYDAYPVIYAINTETNQYSTSIPLDDTVTGPLSLDMINGYLHLGMSDNAASITIFSIEELYCDQPESYYDNVIIGTDSTEIITGTSQNDLILGLGGDDSIKGGAGDDCIYAGEGNDVVIANAGNDIIYGESGNDALFGNRGADTIFGGDGNDIIWGQSGIDTIDAGNDSDICVSIIKDTILSCEITS